MCHKYAGSRRSDFTWFPGGPSLDQLPLPDADPDRPPGSQCSECSGYCHGHYLKPAESLQVGCFTPPPSSVISRAYKDAQLDVTELARVVMLPEEEVDIWLKHLQTVSDNRKRGASKAAETRRHNTDVKDNQLYFCGVCGGDYEEETEETENWIGCDECNAWFHWVCVNIYSEPASSLCINCEN